jgi:phosphoenolpyruvate synthase/pyruvate phosphate dikinase
MEELVTPLTGHAHDREPLIGVKAARLDALIAAGLPVPESFVVTTTAFRRMDRQLTDEAGESSPGSSPTMSHGSPSAFAERRRDRIRSRPVPDDVTEAVLGAYRALGDETGPALVAVRSSAVFEDTLHASHAGLLTSTLAVSGERSLLAAIQECWAGAYSWREMSYRLSHGGGQHGFDTAVIVQRMVDAVSSGVLFTCDPVTGHDAPVIEGTWGLGIGVVDGQVVPDSWTVPRDGGPIRHHRTGSKRHRFTIVTGESGVRREATPAPVRDQPCLTPDRVRELTSWGLRIEKMFGCRVDVEWALGRPAVPTRPKQDPEPDAVTGTDDMFWILQARPVTTIADEVPDETPTADRMNDYGTSSSDRRGRRESPPVG